MDAAILIKTKVIEINVQYDGGCTWYKLQLPIGTCRKSFPVQCDVKLIDLTKNDYCEAVIYRKVSIDVHKVGLDNSYYTGASIRIQGVGDSKVFIIFPE